jgi:hypothetical protein
MVLENGQANHNYIWPTTSSWSNDGQGHKPFTTWANLCHIIYRWQTLLMTLFKIHTNVYFYTQEKLGENICMNKPKSKPSVKKNVYVFCC